MDASAFFMNLMKHHGLYLKRQIAFWAKGKRIPGAAELITIGGSQMDLYLGKLEPEQIFRELTARLHEKEIYFRNDFIHWISPQDYRILNCSDESRWILRLKKEDPATFIHLHPARYSPFSIRLKANTLKTVLLAATFLKINDRLPGTEMLNKLRKENLSLSPTPRLNLHPQALEFFT